MFSFIWNASTILPTLWQNINRPATHANTKAFVVGLFFDRMKAHASAQSDFTSRFNNNRRKA